MRLIITRHGETLENRAGLLQGHNEGSLSEKGINQAKKLALRLRDEKIDIIYCSDLGRAVKTAEEIHTYHKDTDIEYTEQLRERNFGEFQGRKREDVGWSLNDLNSKFPNPNNGETESEVYKRAESFLKYLSEKHSRHTILLVCHGYIGKVLNGILSQKSIDDISAGASLKNTSLTVYNTVSGAPKPEVVDSVSHLEE